jgi:hypothetical protein
MVSTLEYQRTDYLEIFGGREHLKQAQAKSVITYFAAASEGELSNAPM